MKNMLSFTLITFLLTLTHMVVASEDDHICQVTKQVQEEVNTTKDEPFQIQVYKFSIWPPFIRREEKTAFRTVDSKEIHYKTQIVEVCCSGYKKQGDSCIPSCANGCNHGQCTKPEICSCNSGWMGEFCNETCPVGRFGANCLESCACSPNSLCDLNDGKCYCHPGFTGETCHDPCPEGFYGPNCKHRCFCHHGGTCDRQTGQCSCAPGFVGRHCQFMCPTGYFGENCSNKCTCANRGVCHHQTGKCQCPPGFTGEDCNLPCEAGFYGPNCAKSCECYNADSCDAKSGLCNCRRGWMDMKCLTPCPLGTFGQGCKETCNCTSMQLCDHAEGCVDIKMVNLAGILIEGQGFDQETLQNDTINADVEQKLTKWSMSGLSLFLVLITGIFFAILAALILLFILYKPRSSMDPQKLVESQSTINSTDTSGIYSIHEKTAVYEEVGPRKMFEKKLNNSQVNICSMKSGKENPAFNNLDK